MKHGIFSRHSRNSTVETICLVLHAVILCHGSVVPADESQWTDVGVTPEKIREPYLKTRVFPDASRRQPGNAAVIILRLFCDKNPFAWDMLAKNAPVYLAKSDAEFAREQAREEVPLWFYEELQRAAFREDADWQYPLASDPEFLLPDVMDTRAALRGLAVHCRADIQEGHIDAALDKITVGMGLCWHLKKTPVLLINLIQAENMEMFIDCVQRAIQHPESPNLYWSLTAVPNPTEDFHALADWESRRALLHIQELRDLRKERSPKDWEHIRLRLGLFDVRRLINSHGPTVDEMEEQFSAFETRGRSYLRAVDASAAERVDSMSADEVVVRYFVARYSALSDRMMCTLRLPPPEGLRLLRQTHALLREEDGPVIADAIPTISDVYLPVWSIRRRIDALRIVEAVRDYAGRHDGRLPKTLDEIRETPIPLDPMTGRAFQYDCKGDTAYLSGPPIRDEWTRPHKSHVIRLRLRLRQ